MAKKKESFETVLRDLEAEVNRLESGELPLEEALAWFEKGVKSAGKCSAMLKDAELKIEQLTKDSTGNISLEPLPSLEESNGE
ncbi:MAG: exodeoxyribonuclease VII small subunit [Desulfuromonadales bacterium]|nr:exodeoxyribonuclease VII small subunit [Desulfuromonadales bacterium]